MANFFKKLQRIAYQGVSVLNGAVGDKLQNTPFGIKMSFYYQEKAVVLTNLQEQYPNLSTKICVLIHGLTHNETAWEFDDKSDYGSLLQQDLQFTPFYLRYNTGLHISENGKDLAILLEKLYQNYPIPIQEICIIAHSMGGLLTHSACHYAQEMNLNWTNKLKNIFLLATPHLGSFLEKFANVTTNILEKVPNWQTRLVGSAINLRSAGIKDLRFGYLKDEDWKDQPSDKFLKNNQTPIKKVAGVNYYIISGRLTESEKHWVSQLFGDSLVSTKSAAARTEEPNVFSFDPNNHCEFAKTDHFKLSAMTDVYEKIKSWMLSEGQKS